VAERQTWFLDKVADRVGHKADLRAVFGGNMLGV